MHDNDRIVQENNFTGHDPTAPQTTNLVPTPPRRRWRHQGGVRGFILPRGEHKHDREFHRQARRPRDGREEEAAYVQRDGSLAGARTFASSAQSAVNWALDLNTRQFISDDKFDDLRFVKLPQVFTDHLVVAK